MYLNFPLPLNRRLYPLNSLIYTIAIIASIEVINGHVPSHFFPFNFNILSIPIPKVNAIMLFAVNISQIV